MVTEDNQEIADWIDTNLIATTYTIGRRAIIITIADETDHMMFELRWAY